MRETGTPIWVGEFGPVYTGDPSATRRGYAAAQRPARLYARYGAGWSLWTYKDVGLQGLVYASPESAYMQRFGAFIARKARLGIDSWGSTDRELPELIEPLHAFIAAEFADWAPYPWNPRSIDRRPRAPHPVRAGDAARRTPRCFARPRRRRAGRARGLVPPRRLRAPRAAVRPRRRAHAASKVAFITDDVAKVRAAIARAQLGLVDREAIAEAVVLCAVAGEHLLVVGPPGTGKSEAVRRVAEELGGAYFEYLVGRFTEPNELFGPIDLRRLREGVVEVETAGMLPEAEVAFLDEVFRGSTAILNTLLGMLNERVFRRGRTALQVGLRVCVGASNSLPDDASLAAFADRFLGRVFVENVADARLEELLEIGWTSEQPPAVSERPLASLDALAAAARTCSLVDVQPVLGQAVRRMRGAGIELSDRRAVRSQRLIAAAAALDGRVIAEPADLWVLPMIAPTADDQATAEEVLADLIAEARNASLVHAAEQFSRGRHARAARLIATSADVLEGRDRLRIEATLREIDAGFATAEMPEELALVRARLIRALDDDLPGAA